MIIDTVSIGPNYRKVTVSCPGLEAKVFRPGQCIRANGRYLALTGVRTGEFDCVVPHKSFLDDEVVSTFEYPIGPGYMNIDTPKAYLVAGGSGIGALVSLVEHRTNNGLFSTVQLFGKNVRKEDVVKAFPCLDDLTVDFRCKDSEKWGRPYALELFPKMGEGSGHPVFFAGPQGMLEELKKSPYNPLVHLNY
jgi:hypothetical protein